MNKPLLEITISEQTDKRVQTQIVFPGNQMKFDVDFMNASLEEMKSTELLVYVHLWCSIADTHGLELVIRQDVVAQLVYAAYWAGFIPHLEIVCEYDKDGIQDIGILVPIARIRFAGANAPASIVIERYRTSHADLINAAYIDAQKLTDRIEALLNLVKEESDITHATCSIDKRLLPNYISESVVSDVLEGVWDSPYIRVV